MKKRIVTAVVLIPALLLILLAAPKWATAVLFGLISGLAAYELLYTTGLVRHIRLVGYSVLTAFLVPLWCQFGMNPVWGRAGLLLFFLLMFMEMMLSDLRMKLSKISVCFAAAILLPYMLSSVVRIMTWSTGRFLVLIPFGFPVRYRRLLHRLPLRQAQAGTGDQPQQERGRRAGRYGLCGAGHAAVLPDHGPGL